MLFPLNNLPYLDRLLNTLSTLHNIPGYGNPLGMYLVDIPRIDFSVEYGRGLFIHPLKDMGI